MNKRLEKLQKQKDLLWQRVNEISDTMHRLREKEELPALRAKYRGKYFKFRNSDGRPRKWWVYYKVLEPKLYDAYTFNFQCVPNDETGQIESIQIERREFTSYGVLEVECSKNEFEHAYQQMLVQIATFDGGHK